MLRQILVTIPNTKFHENPTDGICALPRGDGRAESHRLLAMQQRVKFKIPLHRALPVDITPSTTALPQQK